MKSDISNTIDLDNILSPKQPEQIIEEVVEAQPISISWDEILTEWSYQCPKGYPTIVNGVFTEYEEVKILNEILEEKFGKSIPLPEATAPDTNTAQKIHNAIISSGPYKAIILPTQATQPTIEKQSKNGIVWRIELAGKDQRVSLIKQLANSLTPQTLKKITGQDVSISYGDKYFTVSLGGYKITYLLKPAKKESQTDTDVKEGMSVVLSYYPDYIPTMDVGNIKQVAKDLLKFLTGKENTVAGLSQDTVSKCEQYLRKITATNDVKVLRDMVSVMNQNNSHANTFDVFFQKNKDYYIERDKLFNEIRTVGRQVTGLPADKWCPGDVYFIKNGSEGLIGRTLTQAKQLAASNKEQAVGLLNSLFSDKYINSADKPIVAVSLKMEDAQAGKLKSGFAEYSDIDTEYGLDPAELKYNADDYKKGIAKYQALFAKELKKADVDIKWTTDKQPGFVDLKKINDITTLKFKYAAYKALAFILSKVANNNMAKFDDALVSLVAFGLGVITKSKNFKQGFSVNPPFFKVMASKKGIATKPVLFKPGSALYLFNVDGSPKPKITIEDNVGYKGLAIAMGIGMGEDKFDIRIRINSNGNTQVNVELEKARHLEA